MLQVMDLAKQAIFVCRIMEAKSGSETLRSKSWNNFTLESQIDLKNYIIEN